VDKQAVKIIRKMLTRNLYDLQEVKASLAYAMLVRKLRESLFWAQEILASECGWELGDVLIQFWLQYCCPYDMSLPNAIKTLDYEGDMDTEIVAVIMRLIQAQTGENKIMEIFVEGFNQYPFPCYKVKPRKENVAFARMLSEKSGIPAIICLKIWNALGKGEVSRAWHIAFQEGKGKEGAVADIIPLLAEGVPVKTIECLLELSNILELKVHSYIACFLLIGLSKAEKIKARKKTDIEYDNIPGLMLSVASWFKKQGKRAGRVHAIEPRALYGLEKKAELYELYDIYPRLKDATPFWQRIIGGYDLTDDNKKEEFYDTWFPNDIPDEWSLEDQKMSHRLNGKEAEDDPLKFLEIFYRKFRKSRRAGAYKKLVLGRDFRNMEVS
jgi:hypothetical protein